MSELKPESILTFLGFKPEEIKTEEDFKTTFEKKFGIKEQLINDENFVAPIFGKRIGAISNKLLSSAHRSGIELPKEKAKEMKVEEMIDYIFDQNANINKKAMEDLEKQTKGTVDEQVKSWKEKYSQVETKAKEWESMANKTASEFDNYKKDQVTRIKNERLNSFKKDVMSKLDFKQDITPVEKVGFESLLNDKYEFDLDETENPFIKDKKTGQRVPSKKVTGQFMTADEIFNEELISNKLAKINPNGGKPAPAQRNYTPPQGSEQTQGTKMPMFGSRFMNAGKATEKIVKI